MDPAANDQPVSPENPGASGMTFDAMNPQPFKPGAPKLPPKLKPAVLVEQDAPPAFKLFPKPAPRIAADEQEPSFPALPAKPLIKPAPALVATEKQAASEPAAAVEQEEDLDEIFRDEVESYLPEIVTALDQLAEDLQHEVSWKQLKAKYHALKGAANTVGLPELGKRAATAEKLSLAAIQSPDRRSSASRDQLIETLQQITEPLHLSLPPLKSCTLPDTSVESEDPITRSAEPEPEAQVLTTPEIEPVLISFSAWAESGSDSAKEQFLAEASRFQGELDLNVFDGLYRSFSQLIDFCGRPLASSPPPSIFCSVITHTLNDARIYLQAKRYNPKLNWSRKWHFYFSSLQIALASHAEVSATSGETLDPEMVAAFLEEAGDHLQHIEQALIAWENKDQPEERRQELRRYYHTLKGAANSVGLTRLGADFHILEDAMDNADPKSATRDFLPHLFDCLDETRRYIELLQADPQSPWPGDWKALLHPELARAQKDSPSPAEMEAAIDPDMLEVFVEESENLLEPIESAIMALEADDQTEKQQGMLRRHFHTLKGAANSIGLATVGAEFHALEDFMEGELASADSSQLTSFLLLCLDQFRAYIIDLQSNPKTAWPCQWTAAIEALKKGETPDQSAPADAGSGVTASKAPAAEKQMLRVEAGQLQELMHMISELLAEQNKMQHYVSGLRLLHSNLQKLYTDSTLNTDNRYIIKNLADDTNRIKEALDNDDQLFRRYSKRIQSDLLELNMGPVGSLFHRLSRSFRDACKEEKKEAVWLPEGGDVQLDRSVVDQLYGPLLHVVRNAVAHGIESPEKRREAGKDPSGKVRIRAVSKSDHVIIEISDDGAGIRTDAVRRKAVEKGLLDDSVPSISSEQAVELLFSPGFSTKDAVSNVAGRGVGLDVVKGDIEALNGSVGVNNVEGQGTTWIIRVPLTLSASEALLVHAGDFKIALPLSMVDRCTGLSSGHIGADTILGKISVDNEPIPLLNLSCFLGSGSRDALTHAVVIDSGLERAAVAVTALDTRREIVMKDLGPLLAPLTFYSGVTSDVDGSLLPVLQIPNLLKWISKQEHPAGPPAPETDPLKHLENDSPEGAVVLLADDSPSVRKVQEKQLTQLGFSVLLAKDGQEAMDILKINTVDLLITDWEMPRMDGAQLIRATRENTATHELPIIVISSKVNDDFEKEAIQLGATACLAKPFKADQFFEKLNANDALSLMLSKLDIHTEH